ncbi:hypothetical protein [Streptomyces sp. WAC 01325]|uniref:hypothetical protein n=1 Tax=Streptomyces sp. WAC 01325 TaxID=2203202 RepID=UPI0021B0637D|nr:hypothetical protein [Streptomyces sp. WAC 01325]
MRLRRIGALTAMSGLLCVPAHANGAAGSAATGPRSTETPSWLVAQLSAPLNGAAAPLNGAAAPLNGAAAPLNGAAAPDPLNDISRDNLAPNDGWAADGVGTTGGSIADDAHVMSGGRGLHNAYDPGSERGLPAHGGRPPTLHAKIDSAGTADRAVARGAGAGRLP